jgi:DNA topoisomerase-1
LEAVDALLEPYIYRNFAKGTDPRACPACSNGRLGLKTGKFGAFLGCSNYPTCSFTKQLSGENEGGDTQGSIKFEPKVLGSDSKTGMEVTMKKGPYGMYVQLGNEKKPKRASLPKGTAPEQMTLEIALSLLSLPREVGIHPETGKMITAGRGRFGPYLLHDGKYTSLKGDDDILTIGINRAVAVIADKKAFAKSTVTPLKVLGIHPEGGGEIAVYSGRYGNYVKHGKTNASIPKDVEIQNYTLEEAVELLAGKAGKGKKKKPATKVRKKTSTKDE